MAHETTDRLLEHCESLYKLVLLASRRAKELADGSPALVKTRNRKVTMQALDEIVDGKVFCAVEEEPVETKKKRKTKAKKK